MTDNNKVESMDASAVEEIIVRAKTSLEKLGDIEDDEQMNVVQNSRNYLKRILSRVDQLFDPIIVKIRESLKVSRDQKALLSDPLKEIDRAFGTKLSLYLTAKMKKKEEEERLAQIEKNRLKRKQEKKLEKAAELESAGKTDQANAVFQEVEEIAEHVQEEAPIVKAPDIQHGHMREVWEAEYIDEKKIPRKYWTLNRPFVERTVRAQKDKTNIPGVRAVKRIIPVSTRT